MRMNAKKSRLVRGRSTEAAPFKTTGELNTLEPEEAENLRNPIMGGGIEPDINLGEEAGSNSIISEEDSAFED